MAVAEHLLRIENSEDATRTRTDDLLHDAGECAYEFYVRGFEFLPVTVPTAHADQIHHQGRQAAALVAISGLGENAAWDLMRGREGEAFLSVEEVAAACPEVSKTHIQMLREAGAFGDLPDTSQVSFF